MPMPLPMPRPHVRGLVARHPDPPFVVLALTIWGLGDWAEGVSLRGESAIGRAHIDDLVFSAAPTGADGEMRMTAPVRPGDEVILWAGDHAGARMIVRGVRYGPAGAEAAFVGGEDFGVWRPLSALRVPDPPPVLPGAQGMLF